MKNILLIIGGTSIATLLIIIANKLNLFSWVSKLFRGNNNNSDGLIQQLSKGLSRIIKGTSRALEDNEQLRGGIAKFKRHIEETRRQNKELRESIGRVGDRVDEAREILEESIERGERLKRDREAFERRTKEDQEGT